MYKQLGTKTCLQAGETSWCFVCAEVPLVQQIKSCAYHEVDLPSHATVATDSQSKYPRAVIPGKNKKENVIPLSMQLLMTVISLWCGGTDLGGKQCMWMGSPPDQGLQQCKQALANHAMSCWSILTALKDGDEERLSPESLLNWRFRGEEVP